VGTYSTIEWTEVTWNPVTGCYKISQGCKHCYAERMAKRLKAMGSARYENEFQPTLHWDLVDQPLRWKKGKTVFVNSMSDLFQDDVPPDFIGAVFRTMAATPQHTYQILTKRSTRLLELAPSLHWPDNVWMGVSVEDGRALNRVDDLRRVPAKVKFLSCEPLIGSLGGLNLEGIHWAIVGGESGPGARPMEPAWVDEIRLEAERSRSLFFFKQWGGVRKDRTGRLLHGRTWDDMPARRSAITANVAV
tara:strand:- start:2584 stop:3324 length:741 start_codon:yes stop_codon:yes gene_type:complete